MPATGWLPDRPARSARLAALSRERAWPGPVDVAWLALWVVGLAGIVFARWETIPFHLAWICLALLYSFRIGSTRATVMVLAAMLSTTFAAITLDMLRGVRPADELTEVPLMTAMFWIVMWHGRRQLAANTERARMNDEAERMLATQRRFLEDASHQLRTPITIALGHSELLAAQLAGNQQKRDINVVVGELNRLRVLSERLLLIAASANPDFLRPEPVELDQLIGDAVWRWRPAADRHWQLGQLDEATALADAERLGLAIDAMVENAIQHTSTADIIRLAVVRDDRAREVSLVVQDSGEGIPGEELLHVFDRFATGVRPVAGRRGTGLGLALVRAVAEGHGGHVRAHSTPGIGSRFELVLPLAAQPGASEIRPADRADLPRAPGAQASPGSGTPARIGAGNAD